jgi:hypothetical protein
MGGCCGIGRGVRFSGRARYSKYRLLPVHARLGPPLRDPAADLPDTPRGVLSATGRRARVSERLAYGSVQGKVIVGGGFRVQRHVAVVHLEDHGRQ